MVLSGTPSGPFVVGETLLLQVDASDPEGGALTFDWDHKPKQLEWSVSDRAEFVAGTQSATFSWDPLASDALKGEPIQLIFIVSDDNGATTEKVVTVDIVPGNGVPDFRSNASELYDPRTGEPLEFEVRVADNDSDQVTLSVDDATKPAGSTFEQTGPFIGRFSWAPSTEQLQRRVHNVTFLADDGTNPVVSFRVTIVVRTASEIVIDKDQTDQECPSAPVIQHTPIGPQRSAAESYRVEAQLTDPRFDELILYLTQSNPFGGDFDPSEGNMSSIAMENEGGTYVAEIPPQTGAINPEVGALTMFYQLCAFDADAGGANEVCAPSSGTQQLWYTFTAYLPDFTECVDDATSRSSFPNDSFETASPTLESWSQFRTCPDKPDFHAVSVRPGETALVAVVFPDGSPIQFAAFDEAQSPLEVKRSECTGMATAEFAVPEGGAQTNFYLRIEGNDTPYVVKAAKSGNPSLCADAANEPNEDAATATAVSDGTALDAEICDSSDVDVYAIDLAAGDNLTVSTSFSNANGNIDMTLFPPSQAGEIDRSGTGVAFTFSFDDAETLEHTATESGTYYLLVFNNDPNANTYNIQFEVGAAPACEDSDFYTSVSPNHSKATAAVIDSTSGTHEYTGLHVCPGQADWFVSTGFNLGTVLGELVVTGGDGTIDDVSVDVFDESDNVVARGAVNAGRIEFDYTPQSQSPSPYYLRVSTDARVVYDLVIVR